MLLLGHERLIFALVPSAETWLHHKVLAVRIQLAELCVGGTALVVGFVFVHIFCLVHRNLLLVATGFLGNLISGSE